MYCVWMYTQPNIKSKLCSSYNILSRYQWIFLQIYLLSLPVITTCMQHTIFLSCWEHNSIIRSVATPKSFSMTCYKRYKNKNKLFYSNTGLRKHTWKQAQISQIHLRQQYKAICVNKTLCTHKTNLVFV